MVLLSGTDTAFLISSGRSTRCKNNANKHSARFNRNNPSTNNSFWVVIVVVVVVAVVVVVVVVSTSTWLLLLPTTPNRSHSLYLATHAVDAQHCSKSASSMAKRIVTPTTRPATVCCSSGVKIIPSTFDNSCRVVNFSTAKRLTPTASSSGVTTLLLLIIVVALFSATTLTNGGASPWARNCSRSDKMLIVNGCNEARFDDRTGSSLGDDDVSWRRCSRWGRREEDEHVGDRSVNVQHGRHV
jgi:hypothetical protein